jgi:SulP family sulfate permease
MEIRGDLYFGAVSHIEESIRQHRLQHPSQRFLLLRMRNVDYCDMSGIRMLESVVRVYRERGGDVFLVRINEQVLRLMKASGFYVRLGPDHVLNEDTAIEYLFYKVLDPAICIYESDVHVFRECQNLPRPDYAIQIPLMPTQAIDSVLQVAPRVLWQQLRNGSSPVVIDVREPREFERGHIPQARLIPLPKLLEKLPDLPCDQPIVVVCRGGRRSSRAAALFCHHGYSNVTMLQGGMLAWREAGLLEAIEQSA